MKVPIYGKMFQTTNQYIYIYMYVWAGITTAPAVITPQPNGSLLFVAWEGSQQQQQPTTNSQQPTTNKQQTTTNNQQPTTTNNNDGPTWAVFVQL